MWYTEYIKISYILFICMAIFSIFNQIVIIYRNTCHGSEEIITMTGPTAYTKEVIPLALPASKA